MAARKPGKAKDRCAGPWAGSTVQSVWLSKAGRGSTKAKADKWLADHRLPRARAAAFSKDRRYRVLQLADPKVFECFRYGPWMAHGEVRFVYAGNPATWRHPRRLGALAGACGPSTTAPPPVKGSCPRPPCAQAPLGGLGALGQPRGGYVLRFRPDGRAEGWCAVLRHTGRLICPEKGGCPIYKGRRCVDNCPFPGKAERESRYVVGEVCFEDLDSLVEVMERQFGKGSVERSVSGNNGLIAYGYQGDSREGEIGLVAAVVRRQYVGSASNDLPIRREADGTYRVIVSDYDAGHIPGRLKWSGVHGHKAIEGRFAQAYGVQVLRKTLPALGYKLEEVVEPDGTVQVRATVRAGGSTRGEGGGGYSLGRVRRPRRVAA